MVLENSEGLAGENIELLKDVLPDYVENASEALTDLFKDIVDNPNPENLTKQIEKLKTDENVAKTFELIEQETGENPENIMLNILKVAGYPLTTIATLATSGIDAKIVKELLDTSRVVFDMYLTSENAEYNKFLTEQSFMVVKERIVESGDKIFGNHDVENMYANEIDDIASKGSKFYTYEILKEYNEATPEFREKCLDKIGEIIAKELKTSYSGLMVSRDVPVKKIIQSDSTSDFIHIHPKFLKEKSSVGDLDKVISSIAADCFLKHVNDIINTDQYETYDTSVMMDWEPEMKLPVDFAENPRLYYKQKCVRDAMKFGNLVARESIYGAADIGENMKALRNNYVQSRKDIKGKK